MNTQNRLVPLDDLLALVEGHSIHHLLTSTQRSEDHRPVQYLCSAGDHGLLTPQILNLDFTPPDTSLTLGIVLGLLKEIQKLSIL